MFPNVSREVRNCDNMVWVVLVKLNVSYRGVWSVTLKIKDSKKYF